MCHKLCRNISVSNFFFVMNVTIYVASSAYCLEDFIFESPVR